jgi:anti-sigma regulatory factor (Ser/Thr protein kinase)
MRTSRAENPTVTGHEKRSLGRPDADAREDRNGEDDRLRRIRVLLADATADFRAEFAAALLSRGRYEVVGEANTPRDAIALAHALQPDVVIVDLDLPRLAGSDLISRLRSEVAGARIVVSTRSGRPSAGGPPSAGDPSAWSSEVARLLNLVEDSAAERLPAVSIDLPNEPDSVARSRRFVESWCRAWGEREVVDPAVLVASELVTNAITHGGGIYELRLRLTRGSLRVEVVDDGEGSPEIRRASDSDEGGRGLQIVSLTSRAWGVDDGDDGTKVIWAELATQ